jgi:hypothetical protein
MSGARGSTQLTLHLQSPAAAAAARQAAEVAAAAFPAAWKEHQVGVWQQRLLPLRCQISSWKANVGVWKRNVIGLSPCTDCIASHKTFAINCDVAASRMDAQLCTAPASAGRR